MGVATFDWTVFLACFAIAAAFCGLLFVRFVFGFLDPWAVMLVLNQSLVLAAMLYFFRMGELNGSHLAYVMASFVAFAAGLKVLHRPVSLASQVGRWEGESETAAVALWVTMLLLIANNVAIFAFAGIPAFREGARTLTMFAELGRGFGVLAYLNQALLLVVPALALRCGLIDGRRILMLVALGCCAVFLAASGGKAGIVELIFVYALARYFIARREGRPVTISRVVYVAIAVGLPITLFAFQNVVQAGYAESIALAVVRRLIETAAGAYYYFVQGSRDGFAGLNLLSYHLAHVTPYFGYSDRTSIELGVNLTLLSRLSFGTPGFGPNPFYFVIGDIWAGWLGLLYSFGVGVVLSYVRFRLRAGFVVWLVANVTATTMVADGTLFSMYLFYAAIFVGIPSIIVFMAVRSARAAILV
jgi:hypothetical protein